MENLFDSLDFGLDDEQTTESTQDSAEDTLDVSVFELDEEAQASATSSQETATAESSIEAKTEEKDSLDLSEFLETNDSTESEIDEPSSTESSSSPYNTFALALSEEGLISLNENEEVKSFDDLKQLIARTIKENEYAGLSDNQKLYLDSIRNGIPEDTVVTSLKTTANYEKIDASSLEENEELRVSLITEDFISKGFAKDKAEKLAKRSVELGEDLDDSKEALTNLKALAKNQLKSLNEQKEKEAELAEKQYQATLTKIKDTLEKTEAIIPGIPMNSRTKDEVFTTMTSVAGHDQYGNPLNALGVALQKNREDVELKLNYLFTVTKGLTDFSVLKATTKSSVLKDLEASLQTNTLGSGKTKSSGAVQSTSLKGTLAAIDNFKL